MLSADGVAIIAAIAIMAFLESAHPTPALFGQTPAETGLNWQLPISLMNDYYCGVATKV